MNQKALISKRSSPKVTRKESLNKPVKAVRLSDVTLPKDYSLQKTGITQSMLSTFMSCRMRFLLAVNRWKPIHGNGNVDFGSLFHELLDKAYHKEEPPQYKRIGKWIDAYLEKNQEQMNSSAEEQERMAAVAHVLLDEYCRFYRKDWENKKFTEIEEMFDVDFAGARLIGKIDGGFELAVREMVKAWLMEHKTKGRIDEEFLTLMLGFDFQNLFYITAKEVGWDINIYGMLYNVVRNPGHKIGAKTIEEFTENLRKEIRKNPKNFFKRYEIPYSAQDKKLFRRELKEKLSELQQMLDGKLAIYRNQHACLTPYRCTYLKACSSGSLAGYKQAPRLFPELGEAYAVRK